MPFSLPLDSNSAHSNSARALDEWLNTDRFLPFAEWIQASSFYTVLLNKAADNPALGVHEAAVYGGHVFAVQTRVHGSNWDIFREYDRRVRQEVAGCRKTSTRMRFDIRSINQPLLILSASAIRGACGETIDMQGVLQSPWGRLFDAPYVDRAKIHQSWTAPVQALSQSVTAPSSPKRKAPRINNVSFGNPPAASSSSSQYPALPIWCPICCTYTTTHRWKTCNSPASSFLYRCNNGWRMLSKEKNVCLNFNSNQACSSNRPRAFGPSSVDSSTLQCPYGHYCSKCGLEHRSCTGICTQYAASSTNAHMPTVSSGPAFTSSQQPPLPLGTTVLAAFGSAGNSFLPAPGPNF